MKNRQPSPGVSRSKRISEEGLERLEKQLQSGPAPSRRILSQWIKRYGEPARELLRQYGKNTDELED